MHDTFLQDLAVVMIVAGVVTVVFRRLGQPVVLGYVLAGVIIGPFTPGMPLLGEGRSLVGDERTVRLLSELGLVFLMFSSGLRFSFRKLLEVGATAAVAAALEIVLMVWLGYTLGRAFGWSATDSVFLGGMLAITSTTIVIKVLQDLGKSREKFAQIIVGVSVVEDTLGIVLIALLPTLARSGDVPMGAILSRVGWLGVFLVLVGVLGLLAVPVLMRRVALFRSREVLLVTSLGLCFTLSLVSTRLFGTVALGAFLTGAIIGETPQRARVEPLIEPLRDMFVAVFFVAVGMLIDPSVLGQYWLPTLVIVAAVIVGKSLSCAVGPLLFGHGVRTSLLVGMGMTPIGELSFVIAQLGLSSGLTSGFLYPIAVAVSAATTLTSPYLIRHAESIVGGVGRLTPRPVRDSLEVYSQWVGRAAGQAGTADPIRRLVRRTVIQLMVNTLLLTGLFLTVLYAGGRLEGWVLGRGWMPRLPGWTGGYDTLVWLAGMVVTLPVTVATLRKLRAMAMLVADLTVRRSAGRESLNAVRVIVSNVLLMIGVSVLWVWVLLLSATVLPPWPVLVVVLLIVAGIAWAMWRSLIQMYAKAQVALRETLSARQEDATPPPELRAVAEMLSGAAGAGADVAARGPGPTPPAWALPGRGESQWNAEVQTLTVQSDWACAGEALGELSLRQKTGASVLVIETEDDRIINPGAGQRLSSGDRVTLLGTRPQLDAAVTLLSG